MKKQLKLGQVVGLGFGSVFIIMTTIGVITKLAMNQFKESNDWVDHTYQVIVKLKGLEKSLVDAETGGRGFVITNQENFLEPYIAATGTLDDSFKDIETTIDDNPAQLKRLDQVEQLSEKRLELIARAISLKRQNKEAELVAFVRAGEGKEIMDEIRGLIDEMVEVEYQLLLEREDANRASARLVNLVSIGGTGIALMFGLVVLIFIARKVIQPINQVVTELAASSNEIAVIVEQQERTATQQATSVNQTTTTLDELNMSSRRSADQAETAAAGAQQVIGLIGDGNQSVDQTLTNMKLLVNKVQLVAEQISHLGEQTTHIGNISGLVSDLANQTNMLALNAAVEAVRAGENGKGFAVVATEIRKLADQSRSSAEKISVLVDDIQKMLNSTVAAAHESTRTAQEGVQVTQQTASVFSGVSKAVNNIVMNVEQISFNTEQQAQAIAQVVDAMNSLNLAATETVSSIGQTRLSTQQLNHSARSLQTVV